MANTSTELQAQVRDLADGFLQLTKQVQEQRVKIQALNKAQDLYVDQSQWMRGFCEGHRGEQRFAERLRDLETRQDPERYRDF